MLSYRHGYHAGNHADVLKHLVLVHCLQYLGQKDAPYWYIDTHAGGGLYDLSSEQATKLGEFHDGIERLWQRDDLPPAVAEYVAVVQALNPHGSLKRYPGSPWIADHLLREADKLRLFELHGNECRVLGKLFKDAGRRAQVQAMDGFAGLKAILPPPPKRALVLVDPSYETKDDYRNVVSAMQESLKRFATGTYAIWYPQLARTESRQLPEKLTGLANNWLHVALRVDKPAKNGFGMSGSGMFVINPPWTLHAALQECLPTLRDLLAQGDGAAFTLEHQAS
ncbi:MAG TPA: 23S rRNA (adenine(2030)-N(6))-methyltransferase RlmJ [Rhodocyclaceae bacterium]|nr:23S rRNA (adenine(2030)-N(6))-methyltransferase RlmJ [Rhodocyclaceae bacterium]